MSQRIADALRSFAQRSEQALGGGRAGRRRHAALVSPTMSGQSPSKSGPRLAEACRHRHRGGGVQRAVRGRRRHGDRAAARALVRVLASTWRPGTSLAAIVLIGLFAAIAHGAYGNVDLGKGLLVGVPAVAGVVAGTALQQRLSGRTVSLLFAALLVAVAIKLLIG